VIDRLREALAERALNEGYDWLFFIDSDTEPPPDAFRRLRALDHPACSGLYFRRHNPMHACAWADVEPPDTRIRGLKEFTPGEIFDIDLFGLGCSLFHVPTILPKLSRPWFKWTSDLVKSNDDPTACSEDFYFLRKIRKELGIKPKLHTGVLCQHNGLMAVGLDPETGGAKVSSL